MLKDVEIAGLVGLTGEEAAARLRIDGYNELPASKPRTVWDIAGDIAREPMFLLLLSCGGIYLSLGDINEAIMLLGFVVVVMTISLYQQHKTERVLDALRDLSSPRALVIRDGTEQRIPGREVVRGDMVVLAEGDRVPADARLLWCSNLSVDESLLTGESVPVHKRVMAGDDHGSPPGGDNQPYVYAGTLAVRGRAIAETLATGTATQMGHIGKALQTITPERTPLQRETDALVRFFAGIGIVLCVVVVLVYGYTRDDWRHGLLAGLTLAMSILPEEFPVILTVFLALGVWRISRHNVLTRRVPAVEALGATTVLCVDKTGTLTQNRMSVRALYVAGESVDVGVEHGTLPEAFHILVEYAILASQRDPFDPMDRALRRFGSDTLARTEHLHEDWALVREYPLSPQLQALSHVWRARNGARYIIAAKGAPEAIADLCHLSEDQATALHMHVVAFADQGLRVLGVARATFRSTDLPPQQHDFEFEFLGLVGLADPIRLAVPAAVAACRSAGVRVVMITGDYPATARSIARQIGLASVGDVVTGAELERMSAKELHDCVASASIYARIVPEQKLQLVQALKARGEVVAMTGDGVNDAPALKAAHIGIAMGGRGTDVAREAADLVLLDDDFSSIVSAVSLGRRIADNLRKAMAYTVAVHVPIVGLTLLPVLMGWPLLLTPVHVVFLELIIDPACSIVFEAEEAELDAMRRPPRPPQARIFDRRTLAMSLAQGAGVFLVVLALYMWVRANGFDLAEGRALAFIALVSGNLALIFTNRSWSRSMLGSLNMRNPALWWVTGGASAFLALVMMVPWLRALFGFSTLPAVYLALGTMAGVTSILWFEAYKRWVVWRRRQCAR